MCLNTSDELLRYLDYIFFIKSLDVICWSWKNLKSERSSQNHRMLGVGRDLCGSSSPTLAPKQGHLQQAAQDLVQAGLEYLQRGSLHNLPGQPVPGLRHPQSEPQSCCRALSPTPIQALTSPVVLKACFAAVRRWICWGWMPPVGTNRVPGRVGGHMRTAHLPVPLQTGPCQPRGSGMAAAGALPGAAGPLRPGKGSRGSLGSCSREPGLCRRGVCGRGGMAGAVVLPRAAAATQAALTAMSAVLPAMAIREVRTGERKG